MQSKHKILLLIDGIVDIILGVLLLLYPAGIVELLGLPATNTNFYPTILGAVILGVGISLIMELIGFNKKVRGLSLGGAIVINIIGSVVLIIWLLFGSLHIPIKGFIILWLVGLTVLFIGVAELITKSWYYD